MSKRQRRRGRVTPKLPPNLRRCYVPDWLEPHELPTYDDDVTVDAWVDLAILAGKRYAAALTLWAVSNGLSVADVRQLSAKAPQPTWGDWTPAGPRPRASHDER